MNNHLEVEATRAGRTLHSNLRQGERLSHVSTVFPSDGEVGAREAGIVEEHMLFGPVVIAVRGPSRSGKTALCERMVAALATDGLRCGWVKRTHHLVDTPGKASDRIWNRAPAATALRACDRLQITLPPGSEHPRDMIAELPADLDVVLVETHEPVDYPTVVSAAIEPADGEHVIGRWDLYSEDSAVATAIPLILQLLPRDRSLDLALRAATRLHGGHGCAGLILGTRVAMAGAAALGITVPDREKRLIVVSETERCAVDGIQAVTGCRPGKRTLRMLDYGKLAATFLDEQHERAVRVAVRGDLRDRVGANGPNRYALQRQAYARWSAEDLFVVRDVAYSLSDFDRPGPPSIRVRCGACDEEVSDGRHVDTASGPQCRPCWAMAYMDSKGASK